MYLIAICDITYQACLPCYKKVIEQSQVVAVAPKQQGNAAADNRNASITDNLAPRSSPEKKGKKSDKDIASTDDIYGRLSFAGATSSGYIGAVTGEVPDHRMSMLETSFAEAVEERPDIMSPWIHAILFFRTDDSQSPVLEASVPKGRVCEVLVGIDVSSVLIVSIVLCRFQRILLQIFLTTPCPRFLTQQMDIPLQVAARHPMIMT